MRLRNVLIVLFATAVTGATGSAEAREHSWVQRAGVAVFGSEFDGSSIFEARCDAAAGQLVLTYFPDEREVTVTAHDGLGLWRSTEEKRRVTLQTRLLNGRLEGRVRLDTAVMARLSLSGSLEIGAPNGMEEAWHTGEAAPLMRVARACLRR